MLLREMSRESYETYTKIVYCGGNNGHCDWVKYLDEISDTVKVFCDIYGKDNVVIEKIETDVLDDIFYVHLIIYKGEN